MGFVTRSLLVLLALYGLVFAIGDAYLLHGGAPIWWGILFVVAIIGVQYLVSPWLIELFYTITWYEDDIPAAHRDFVSNLCRTRGLPALKIGLIESGTPNAFAYGRLRRDARIVVTRGLLDVLTEDEVNAVLAHEVGHVAHYDFATMALAAMAPLVLYQVYIWTSRVDNLRIVSYAAYIAYWFGQFLVLLLNRTREYGADHFSATVTGQPCQLSSALVKIGYGMVHERSEQRRLMKEGDKDAKKEARKRLQFGSQLGLLGIASASGSDAMALAINSPEEASRIMQWDLVNPWARFYELSSTHPLTAFRLRALNKEAVEHHQTVSYPLPADTRTRWQGFPIEFLFWFAPIACVFFLLTWFWIGRPLERAGLHLPANVLPCVLILTGISYAARILFRYHGAFQRKQVMTLLEDLDVSQMRPRAVELEGEIIGHGIPGAIWSADLVLQDATGMMFLLYRSSIPFARFFFAIRSADRFIGERVTVRGWYRRGRRPYVELSRIEVKVPAARKGERTTTLFGEKGQSGPVEYETLIERSYSRWLQLAASAICLTVGLIWLS